MYMCLNGTVVVVVVKKINNLALDCALISSMSLWLTDWLSALLPIGHLKSKLAVSCTSVAQPREFLGCPDTPNIQVGRPTPTTFHVMYSGNFVAFRNLRHHHSSCIWTEGQTMDTLHSRNVAGPLAHVSLITFRCFYSAFCCIPH